MIYRKKIFINTLMKKIIRDTLSKSFNKTFMFYKFAESII